MNEHLNDGQLRAALDGELDAEHMRHLADCQLCQTRQQQMQLEVSLTASRMNFLSASSQVRDLPTATAWHRFNQQKLTKETSMFRKLFASPLVRYGASALLLLTIFLAIPSTRALASELLNLFRVQRVEVVPVDFTGMDQLDGAVSKDISQLIANSITMTKKPEQPTNVTDASQATSLAGFNVRAPQGFTPSRISVMDGSNFTVTVDRTKAQALLQEAGRSDLTLPESIDGAQISVNIPASVSFAFGNCPEPSSDSEAERELKRETTTSGSPGRVYANCVIFSQVPSPEVSAPASVDVAQLAQLGLEFSGMSADQAKAFTSNVDWTSTLVVPIPKNAATNEQVSVDGVTGTLIQRPTDDAPQFLLIWVKDGIIYAIGGLGSNSQQAIQMANSLP